MSEGKAPNGIDAAELGKNQAVLDARSEEIRKQLDRGVTRAEFKQLYALQSAVKRAAAALADIRASLGLS